MSLPGLLAVSDLDRVIQCYGKSKLVGFWIPRIYQPRTDKPEYDDGVCGKQV